MFKLYAASSQPGWSGQIAAETFPTLEEAESRMREWALFGVDAYCNEPDRIWITNADEQPLKYWSWRTRAPCKVQATERTIRNSRIDEIGHRRVS